jgi:hypothetical protein
MFCPMHPAKPVPSAADRFRSSDLICMSGVPPLVAAAGMWAGVLICPEAMRSTVLVIEMTLSSAETEFGLPVGGQGVH